MQDQPMTVGEAVVPLARLGAGRTGTVDAVAGGRGARVRLLALGFVRGQVVRVIKNDGFGPVIVALGETRVAVGRGLAGKVQLRLAEAGASPKASGEGPKASGESPKVSGESPKASRKGSKVRERVSLFGPKVRQP